MQLLFNFELTRSAFLALATGKAEPLRRTLEWMQSKPDNGQWLNFIRHLDEVNLERLSDDEREAVFEAFAPDESMRFAGRGIRRRLAPMLGNDMRKVSLAFSLVLSSPRVGPHQYGDEIGMGDDLSLPGRDAVRTPMQWTGTQAGGFSTAPEGDLVRPVISGGEYGYQRRNVADEWARRDSLLSFVTRLVGVRREFPEFGFGEWRPLDAGHPAVLAHAVEWRDGTCLALHNFADEKVEARVEVPGKKAVTDIVTDGDYPPLRQGEPLPLNPYGFRWLRVGADPRDRYPS